MSDGSEICQVTPITQLTMDNLKSMFSEKSAQNMGLHPIRSQVHVDDMGITSIMSQKGITINVDHEVDNDEAMVLAMGYKQEFEREFTLWSIFAVSFSVMGLLPSMATTFLYQQLVIGLSPVPWLLGVFFVSCVSFSLAELASAFPVSTGTPYAVYQLAPPKYKAFLTWLTCWANWMCQITAFSINYSAASMILAIVTYNNPSFVSGKGTLYGLTTAINAVSATLACFPTKWAARINSFGTSTNIVFLFIVFVIILTGNDRLNMYDDLPKFNSNATAWGFTNQTDFPTGIATLMSFLGVIWSMAGYDAPFHLSEECSNASTAVPKAIMLTSTVGGLMGWIFMIAISYTLVNVEKIAEDPLGLGQPFVTYFTQFLSVKMVNACTAMTVVSTFFMGSASCLGASRVTFAYSRDNVLPLSKWWKIVNPVTKTPVNAAWFNFVLQQLLLLLLFAGTTAIGAIFSVGGIAGFISFTMPTLLKITYARNTFVHGPVHLGKFSTPIGIISVAFVATMIPILCMSSTGSDLSLENMNWTVVVFFGPWLLATLYFLLFARKWYNGPKSNIPEADLVYENGNEVYNGVEVVEDKHTTSSLNKDSIS